MPTNLPSQLRIVGIRTAFEQLFRPANELQDWNKISAFDSVVEQNSRYDVPLDVPLMEAWAGQNRYSGVNRLFVDYKIGKYQNGIQWTIDEDVYNKSQFNILAQAQQLATQASNLPKYLAEEMLEGTAGSAGGRYYKGYNGVIPAAYDGNGIIYNSTRAGVTAGNKISGSGTTTDAIITDIKSVLAVFHEMENEVNARKYWEGASSYKLICIVPPEIIPYFTEVMTQKMAYAYATSAVTDKSYAYAAPYENVWGSFIEIIPFGGLSDSNDWYAVMSSPEYPQRKPFLTLQLSGMEDYQLRYFNETTDKINDEKEIRQISVKRRLTVVPLDFHSIIEVENS